MNVGLNGFKLGTIDTRHAVPNGMPRCDPNGKLPLAQVLDDASTEKARPAENGDSVSFHDLPGVIAMISEVPELYRGGLATTLRFCMTAGPVIFNAKQICFCSPKRLDHYFKMQKHGCRHRRPRRAVPAWQSEFENGEDRVAQRQVL